MDVGCLGLGCLPVAPCRSLFSRCLRSYTVSRHPPVDSLHGWRGIARSLPQQEREEEGRNDNPAPNPTGSRPAHQVRRALGLDYGRRVVGLAVSTLGLAPRPLEGLPGPLAHEQLQLAAAVLAVAQREACDAIVLGLPVTLAGSLRRRSTDSQQGRRCRNFADNMAAVAAPHAIPVFLADERGSTLAARELLASSGSRRSTLSKVQRVPPVVLAIHHPQSASPVVPPVLPHCF